MRSLDTINSAKDYFWRTLLKNPPAHIADTPDPLRATFPLHGFDLPRRTGFCSCPVSGLVHALRPNQDDSPHLSLAAAHDSGRPDDPAIRLSQCGFFHFVRSTK